MRNYCYDYKRTKRLRNVIYASRLRKLDVRINRMISRAIDKIALFGSIE